MKYKNLKNFVCRPSGHAQTIFAILIMVLMLASAVSATTVNIDYSVNNGAPEEQQQPNALEQLFSLLQLQSVKSVINNFQCSTTPDITQKLDAGHTAFSIRESEHARVVVLYEDGTPWKQVQKADFRAAGTGGTVSAIWNLDPAIIHWYEVYYCRDPVDIPCVASRYEEVGCEGSRMRLQRTVEPSSCSTTEYPRTTTVSSSVCEAENVKCDEDFNEYRCDNNYIYTYFCDEQVDRTSYDNTNFECIKTTQGRAPNGEADIIRLKESSIFNQVDTTPTSPDGNWCIDAPTLEDVFIPSNWGGRCVDKRESSFFSALTSCYDTQSECQSVLNTQQELETDYCNFRFIGCLRCDRLLLNEGQTRYRTKLQCEEIERLTDAYCYKSTELGCTAGFNIPRKELINLDSQNKCFDTQTTCEAVLDNVLTTAEANALEGRGSTETISDVADNITEIEVVEATKEASQRLGSDMDTDENFVGAFFIALGTFVHELGFLTFISARNLGIAVLSAIVIIWLLITSR